MKKFFTKNFSKTKNILCLIGLLLLGFFTLKHFNLIEGMSDDIASTDDNVDLSQENDKEYKKENKKEYKKEYKKEEGNFYEVNINVEAPSKGFPKPAENQINPKVPKVEATQVPHL